MIFEGTGVAEQGYDVDCLVLEESNFDPIGITKLAELAGVEPLPETDANAFEQISQPDPIEYRRTKVDDYRKENKRKYPPVYRFKITIEAEEVSEDQAEAYWKKRGGT
jgi:hypothetical protein